MDNIVAQSLMQLASRVPTLLVCAVGLILAIVYWKRYPRPCLLVFTALCLAVFALVTSAFLFMYLPRAMVDLGWDHQRVGAIIGVVAFTANLLQAGAMALLLSAVFVGRRQPPPRWSPDDDRTVADHIAEPRGIQGDITDTGIQR
jgi:hypothetical protein